MSIKDKLLQIFFESKNEESVYPHVDDLIAMHAKRPGMTGSGHGQYGPFVIWFRNNKSEINIANITNNDEDKRPGDLRRLVKHIEGLAKKHGYPRVTFGQVLNPKISKVVTSTSTKSGYEYQKDPFGMDEYNPPSYTKVIK